jgi:hypothetical protein
MRYTKSTMKAAQLEERYVPVVRQLAADISADYDRRLTRDGPESGDAPSFGDARGRDSQLSSRPAPFAIAAGAPALGRLQALQAASR